MVKIEKFGWKLWVRDQNWDNWRLRICYHSAIVRLSVTVVRLSFAIVLHRSPIVRLSFAVVHLSFAIAHQPFTDSFTNRSPVVCKRSPILRHRCANRSASFTGCLPHSPFLFACGLLQFLFRLFSVVCFSTMPPKSRFSQKHPQKRAGTTLIATSPMKLGLHTFSDQSVRQFVVSFLPPAPQSSFRQWATYNCNSHCAFHSLLVSRM